MEIASDISVLVTAFDTARKRFALRAKRNDLSFLAEPFLIKALEIRQRIMRHESDQLEQIDVPMSAHNPIRTSVSFDGREYMFEWHEDGLMPKDALDLKKILRGEFRFSPE